MEKDELLEKLLKLIESKSGKNFQIAWTNFQIGKLLSEVDDLEAITKELSRNSNVVRESFLYDCKRVFKSLKNEGMLKEINSRLKGNLNWWFLVNNCTKAPEGDNPESILYWEEKIGKIENALNGLGEISDSYDLLPASLREQISGLSAGIAGSFANQGQRTVLDGPVRVGHIADIHMSETLQSGGKIVIDPITGMNERLLDIHRCFSYAVDLMIEKGCRVALITEPTETHQPTPNEERYLLANILRLTENGIPVIVEPGNHGISKKPKDSSGLAFLQGRANIHVVEKPSVFYLEGNRVSSSPSAEWPMKDCAKIFVLPFPSRGILGTIEGLSIEEANKAASAALRTILWDFRGKLDKDVPNILMTHVTVIGATGAENPEMTKYDPHLYPEDLEGFHYVALGHIHIKQEVAKNVFYAGSLDRMDFSEEGDDKGFMIATFEDGETKPEFVKTPARAFKTIGVEFFQKDEWEKEVDPKTIYRIKGEITHEERESLRPHINRFMEIVPLLYKLTVKRPTRVRDEHMTEDIKEEDAMRHYLKNMDFDDSFINRCLQTFNEIVKGDGIEDDTSLVGTKERLVA